MASSNINETDDLTTCVVCFERYDNGDRLPKYLLCLHTFCISCLSKMLLDSYSMTICCPACRAVTSPGNSLVSLRTNEHALRVLELEETIRKLKTRDGSQHAWCHSCDDLASSDCTSRQHNITLLSSNNMDSVISKAQMNTIKLRLSYALNRRREVETYLQLTHQSLNILDNHVSKLKEDNASQIRLLEGIIDELSELGSSSKVKSETKVHSNSAKTLEIAVDTAYSSAISFARTLDGAKDLLVSLNFERLDGKTAMVLPSSYQMRLSLTNLAEEQAITTAGLNTLAFILLMQLQQRHLDLMQVDLLQHSDLQYAATSNANNQATNPAAVLQSFFPLLYSRQCCFLDIEFNIEARGRLVFELLPECPFELRNAFLNSFSHHRGNHLNSSIVKAGVSLFVVFGSVMANRHAAGTNSETFQENDGPIIRNRGDVGIYLNNNSSSPPDIVVLLAPFSERNVRRAPLVARIVDGLNICHFLSHLKLQERAYCRIVNCGVQ